MRASRAAIIFWLALGWLLFALAYGYGLLSYKYNLWPHSAILEVRQFVAGDRDESTTLTEKVLNDAGILPTRHLVTPAKLAYPAAAYHRLGGLPLKAERDATLVYLGRHAARGYRVLFGTFTFRDALHGAVLLDPQGKVKRVWKVSQDGVQWKHQRDNHVHQHGFAIGRNGSILTKYDFCGGVQWRLQGEFHHSTGLQDDGTFWTWREGTLEERAYQIAYEDGKVTFDFAIAAVSTRITNRERPT